MEFRVLACHHLWEIFPDPSAIPPDAMSRSRNPTLQAEWFRLFPVRSPLLGESRLFSLPQDTEMFHFSWCSSVALCIQTTVTRHNASWVCPFGNPRIKACLPLPEAYRSLPRPSSPTDAKASIVRPLQLDQNPFWSESTSALVASTLLCNCQRTLRRSGKVYVSRTIRIPSDGGRAWSRTRDLVLIRDAL